LTATDAELDLWMAGLGVVANVVPSERALRVVEADPDDDKYLAAAVEGRADYVVSGDKHLLDIKAYEEIRIIPPRLFLTLIRKGK
jgi:predicted nucleic acid-binding protein